MHAPLLLLSIAHPHLLCGPPAGGHKGAGVAFLCGGTLLGCRAKRALEWLHRSLLHRSLPAVPAHGTQQICHVLLDDENELQRAAEPLCDVCSRLLLQASQKQTTSSEQAAHVVSTAASPCVYKVRPTIKTCLATVCSNLFATPNPIAVTGHACCAWQGQGSQPRVLRAPCLHSCSARVPGMICSKWLSAGLVAVYATHATN